MTIALIIFAVGTFALLVWVLWKMTALDERQDELDKFSVYLDERANRIAQEEDFLRAENKSFRAEVEAFRSRDIYTASYTETDSDTRKYTTDALMEAHARKHLSTAIAQDIVHKFKMVEDKTEEGRRRFTYKFKIAEQ